MGKPVYEKAYRKVEDPGSGNITLLFDPFPYIYERSGEKEFLYRFPAAQNCHCISPSIDYTVTYG